MLALLAATALAAPLNPWGSATAPGTALVNPYLYVYPDAMNPLVYGAAGLSERVDVYVGVGEYLPVNGAAAGAGALEFFPRFFLDPSVAVAAHVYWTPGVDGAVVAPEVHLNHTWERFAITANAGWRPVLSTAGFSAGTVPLIVAPEVRLTDRFSVYVEADPTFSLTGAPVGIIVVPGVGASLDDPGHHGVSAGLQIPVLPSTGPASLGVWYCFTFAAPEEG
jgi:hypothetical protein